MNLRKLNLGLVALLLGFGLVLTQSAFTPTKSTATLYGKVPVTLSNPTGWVDLTGMTEDDGNHDPGTYRCAEGGEVCKASFESTPDEQTPIPPNADEGTFIINP